MRYVLRIVSAVGLFAVLSAGANAETVLITGANQGIGLEFARQYAARGWTVVATHRRDTPPEELLKLQKQYPKVRIEKMDVTDHAQIDSLAAEDEERRQARAHRHPHQQRRPEAHGADHGSPGQRESACSARSTTSCSMTSCTRTSTGPLHIAEAFREHVKASKLKKFITISSAAGTVSVLPRTADNYWYRISKSALNQAMRLVSVDYQKDGVLVVFFHPGGVLTESFKGLNLKGWKRPMWR